MAHVVLGGLFEPGTAVSLYPARDGVFRAAGPHVGRRLVDGAGMVGFDGLEAGVRLVASGFDVYGKPLSVVVRAVSVEDGSPVAQPPVRPSRVVVGTQEAPVVAEQPGAPAAFLHTGVPAGVPVGAALAA